MQGPQARPPRRPQRLAITAAAVVGTAVFAAACGAAPGPVKPTASVPVTTGKLSSRSSDSRGGAQAYGRRLLASLRLPSGARVLPWPTKPPAGLNPTTPAILTDTIDLKGAVPDLAPRRRSGGLVSAPERRRGHPPVELRARGAPRIVVTPSTACGDYVDVRVGRRAEPSLAGGSSLIRVVQRLVRPR